MEAILVHTSAVSVRTLPYQHSAKVVSIQRGVGALQGVRRGVKAHASAQGSGSKGLGVNGVSPASGSSLGAGNGSMALNGVGIKTSDTTPTVQKTADATDVWGWSKDVKLVGDIEEAAGWEGGTVADSSSDEDAPVIEEATRPMPDQDLETITENMMSIERGVKQMNEFTKMLSETAKALSARAQANRIEASKIRKMSAMQQAEQLRHAQSLRKAVELRRAEEKRLELVRGEQAALQQALDEAKATMEMMAPTLSLPTSAPPEDTSTTPTLETPPPPSPSPAPPRAPPTSPTANRAPEAAARPAPAAAEPDDGLGPGAVALPEALECTITHPGALSCTKTTIRKDVAQKSASVTMTVTTRCEGDACLSTSLEVEDYVALSVQTLVDVAHELKHTRFKQRATDADPVVHEKHRSIVEVLKRGKVVSSKPNEPPSKFGHESFVVKLLDPKTNHKVETMFKPRVEGDADGWHRAPVEWVAYELNLMLGMDFVPPVFYRKGGINLDDRHFEEGAFIFYVNNTKPLKRVPAAGWGVSVARLLSDTRILDVLLNNSDRHHGHFLYGEHWVDGKPRPVLIDHAAGFRKEAVVAMDHENAFQTGPVRCVSSRTYLRLRFLERETVAAKFSGVLSNDEINALMRRRDKILAYLDNLVQERGYHRTVIEL